MFLGLLFAAWWVFYIATLLQPKGRGPGELLATCLFMAYGLHLLCKGAMAVQASRCLCEERRSGALELLLVTPLTPETIIDGQWRALKRQFRAILLMLWAINGALLWMFAVNPIGAPNEMRWTFSIFCLGGAILLPVDFYALGWMGMAEAIEGKRHHRAVLGALGRVIALPIIVFLLFMLLCAGSGVSTRVVNAFYGFWVLLALVTSRSAAESRKQVLRNSFRLVASGDKRKPKYEIPQTPFDWESAPAVPPRRSA